MSGSLDWFGENGKDVLNSSELAQLNAAGAGTLYSYMSSSPSGIGFKVNQEPFKDIRVRIALQKAIDIEAIDSQYFGNPEDIVIPGLWSPSLSEWSTAGSWNADLLDEFKYDPEASKALLVEAGYPDGFEFTLQCDPLVDLDLYTLAADYLQAVGVKMNIETAPEMMEAVQVSQDADDPRQFNAFAGGFGDYMLASFMTGDGPIPNSYKHDDQAYKDRLVSMSQASTEDERSAIARELDQNFPAAHWCVFLSGMQPSFDFMSKRIGGYAGEKVYFRQNMRTVWARLWIES
jgi:ABC-type transport system substrate-binding protein